MTKRLVSLLLAATPLLAAAPDPAVSAASAVNTLGLDLLGRAVEPGTNIVLSPFSIQVALVMTYAGAEGETRSQMAAVLHLPENAVEAFSALQRQLRAGPGEITLDQANRLFGQSGTAFRPPFLDLLKNRFDAPLEQLDFEKDPAAATVRINAWVEAQTRNHIRNLVPAQAITRDTALVLVNALYLKAPWAEAFAKDATGNLPFHLAEGKAVEVPTLSRDATFGYRREAGFQAVSIPYVGGALQFLILLPDAGVSVDDFTKGLTPEILGGLGDLPARPLKLFLPKFRLEPDRLALGDILQKMGMTHAFDVPPRSANFDGIAPRRPDDYLFISDVFHKAFLEIDEKGTEAAAATAVVVMRALSAPVAMAEPLEVRVDRPFLFAVRHQPSGACLFLGRMMDPR